jgi:hypothetical protein
MEDEPLSTLTDTCRTPSGSRVKRADNTSDPAVLSALLYRAKPARIGSPRVTLDSPPTNLAKRPRPAMVRIFPRAHHSSSDLSAHLPTRPLTCFCADSLQDLHVYDPDTKAWTNLSAPASGTSPPARWGHGFTSAGGKLYVHGGYGFGSPYYGRTVANVIKMNFDNGHFQ